jgi:hypothetical protein
LITVAIAVIACPLTGVAAFEFAGRKAGFMPHS